MLTVVIEPSFACRPAKTWTMWLLSRLRVMHYVWISEELQKLEVFSSKVFWDMLCDFERGLWVDLDLDAWDKINLLLGRGS